MKRFLAAVGLVLLLVGNGFCFEKTIETSFPEILKFEIDESEFKMNNILLNAYDFQEDRSDLTKLLMMKTSVSIVNKSDKRIFQISLVGFNKDANTLFCINYSPKELKLFHFDEIEKGTPETWKGEAMISKDVPGKLWLKIISFPSTTFE